MTLLTFGDGHHMHALSYLVTLDSMTDYSLNMTYACTCIGDGLQHDILMYACTRTGDGLQHNGTRHNVDM